MMATSLKKPCLCFVIDENQPWPPAMIDEEPGRSKLRAFKRTVDQSLVKETFTTPEVLASRIASAPGKFAGIPTAGSVPVAHNLPQVESTNFVGRQTEVAAIHGILRPYPHSQYHLVVIDGIGGIGKTSLALQAATTYLRAYDSIKPEERFDAIVWTSAKSTLLTASGVMPRHQATRTIEDIYQALAHVLGREDITRAPAQKQHALLARALTSQRTLLIVDNLETVDDLSIHSSPRALPAPTKAIVTTRHKIDVAYPIRLAGLSPSETDQILTSECKKRNMTLTPEDFASLSRKSAGVPLVVVWSVGQIGLGHHPESVISRLGGARSDLAKYCFQETLRETRQRQSYLGLLALAMFPAPATTESIAAATGQQGDLDLVRECMSH
jgi:LuxR family glucitol operon transcriptional activator